MEYRKFGDTYVLRLDQGEEVMESLRRFAEAEQISLASVQGIGALSAFDLKAHHYEGCYEITSLLGTIDTMDGQFYCHLHLNAAEQEVLLHKMEAFCQQQTGMSLHDFARQLRESGSQTPEMQM